MTKIQTIGIIGLGYVGSAIAASLASSGKQIIVYDKDKEKYTKLKSDNIKHNEKELKDAIKKAIKNKTIKFANTTKKLSECNVVFIAVGTPYKKSDREIDISHVIEAAEEISNHIKTGSSIIIKSTIAPDSAKKIKSIPKIKQKKIEIISNPEFLREGSSFRDFNNPYRIIIGTDNKEKIKPIIEEIYHNQIKEKHTKTIYTTHENAAIIKLASNAFLAMSISFINEIARISDSYKGNIDIISEALKLDKRIGKNAYLKAGIGFGGSCLKKDTSTLAFKSSRKNLLKSAIETNDSQIDYIASKIEKEAKQKIKKIAFLGLSFKQGTDDIRNSQQIKLLKILIKKGYEIKAYDPAAQDNAKKEITEKITFSTTKEEAIEKSDLIIITTAWEEFSNLDFKKLKGKTIIDAANLFERKTIEKYNIKYIGIGK